MTIDPDELRAHLNNLRTSVTGRLAHIEQRLGQLDNDTTVAGTCATCAHYEPIPPSDAGICYLATDGSLAVKVLNGGRLGVAATFGCNEWTAVDVTP